MRTDIQTERLRTLSRELRKVPEKDFDIRSFVGGKPADIGCGSTACALGYCPLIFPEEWRFTGGDYIEPMLVGLKFGDSFSDAARFFGLSIGTADHLFHPDQYEREEDGVMQLYEPSPGEVADRIDALLAKATEPAT